MPQDSRGGERSTHRCAICGFPLHMGPETVADGDAGAVHEDCYVRKTQDKTDPHFAESKRVVPRYSDR